MNRLFKEVAPSGMDLDIKRCAHWEAKTFKEMRPPGIEPGSSTYKINILPLKYGRSLYFSFSLLAHNLEEESLIEIYLN